MSESPMLTHQPCPRPECGSSDGAIVFADGGTYCYVCETGTKGGTAPDRGSASPFPGGVRAASDLLPVSVQAIPKRSIPLATAEKWGYGYGSYNGAKCQIATYRDARGRPVAQKLRFGEPKRFQTVGDWSKVGLFGAHLWRDGGKSIVITEGELDALSVSAAWDDKWPVVSIPGGTSSAVKTFQQNLEYLEKFEKVVIMFDQDEPGREAAEKAAAVLSPGKAFIATLPDKDANALLMAGRSAEIVKAFWDAKPWRPDGIVTFADAWQRVLTNPHVTGLPFRHSGLQAKIRGMRPGEMTLFIAGTGAGKSTAVREEAAALAAMGARVGYIGLEEGVDRTALGLVSVMVDQPLHLQETPDLNSPAVQKARDVLEKQVILYDAFGSLDVDNLLSRMRYMAKGMGAQVIVLDHLSIVTSGGDLKDDERRVLDRLVTQLTSFVNETKVHVLAVAHLSRDHKAVHEEGARITLKNIRGSHGIAQAFYNVIAIERDQQDNTNTADLRVLKCRHTGLTGLAGRVHYDISTGRQTEIAAGSPFQAMNVDDVE